MEQLTAKEAREIAGKINPNESIEAYLNTIRIAAQDGNYRVTISDFKSMNPIIKNKLESLGFIITEKHSGQISMMNVYTISW